MLCYDTIGVLCYSIIGVFCYDIIGMLCYDIIDVLCYDIIDMLCRAWLALLYRFLFGICVSEDILYVDLQVSPIFYLSMCIRSLIHSLSAGISCWHGTETQLHTSAPLCWVQTLHLPGFSVGSAEWTSVCTALSWLIVSLALELLLMLCSFIASYLETKRELRLEGHTAYRSENPQ